MDETLVAILTSIGIVIGNIILTVVAARKKKEAENKAKEAGESAVVATKAATAAAEAGAACVVISPTIEELQREMAAIKFENTQMRAAMIAQNEDHARDLKSIEVMQDLISDLQKNREEDKHLINQLRTELGAMQFQLRERDEVIRRQGLTIREQAEMIDELKHKVGDIVKKGTGELHHDQH